MSEQDEDVADFLHPEYAGMRGTKARIADLEAEVARLREDKQKQQEYIDELIDSRGQAWVRRREFEEAWRWVEAERDRYRALAERRGEALEAMLRAGDHTQPEAYICPRCDSENLARAAINISPEQAKEKE